jgi:hypothetical protein
MSTYTYLKGDVELYGVEITDKAQLRNAIQEAEEDYANAKDRIKMLAAATPKDVFPSDEDGTTMEKLGWELDAAFEWLEEAHSKLVKLYAIELNSDAIVDIYAPEKKE